MINLERRNHMARKITACGCILLSDEKDTQELDLVCHEFSRAVMSAYNRLRKPTIIKNPFNKDGFSETRFLTKSELEKYIQANFELNARETKDAIELARQTIESQKALIKDYLLSNKKKLSQVNKKLKNTKLKPYQIRGLERRKDKLQKKIDLYETYRKNNTVPGAVFGGKDDFKKLSKGLISKEEFNNKKYGHYYSRGETQKGGNLNLVIYIDNEDRMQITLPKYKRVYPNKVIEANQKLKEYKLKMGFTEFDANHITPYEITQIKKAMPRKSREIFTSPIYIAKKVSKRTKDIKGINYDGLLRDHLKTGKAYTVEVIRKNGKYHLHITFDIDTPETKEFTRLGMLGIDTNPNGLALTRITKKGNYKSHEFIKCPKMLTANSNQRTNLAWELAHKVVNKALKYKVGIAIEDLKFDQSKDSGKKFNRLKHNFAYRKMLEAIESVAIKKGVDIIKVNPAYTSKIGLYKYCHQYGMDIHNGAAMVIARRAYGYKEKVPKELIKRCINPKHESEFYKKNNIKRIAEIDKVVKKFFKTSKDLDEKLKYKSNSYIRYRKEFLGLRTLENTSKETK
jgi:IS605 OrfB family transposase